MRPDAMVAPSSFSVSALATPATAISISLRGMKRWYAAPDPFSGAGTSSATSSSPRPSTFAPGAVQNSSTGTRRSPCGPCTTATVEWTIRGQMPSALGEALHRLPPRLARDCIWMPPMSDAASMRPGNAAATALSS